VRNGGCLSAQATTSPLPLCTLFLPRRIGTGWLCRDSRGPYKERRADALEVKPLNRHRDILTSIDTIPSFVSAFMGTASLHVVR
jgi:hypothetical protein